MIVTSGEFALSVCCASGLGLGLLVWGGVGMLMGWTRFVLFLPACSFDPASLSPSPSFEIRWAYRTVSLVCLECYVFLLTNVTFVVAANAAVDTSACLIPTTSAVTSRTKPSTSWVFSSSHHLSLFLSRELVFFSCLSWACGVMLSLVRAEYYHYML